jgi:peptide/nickel transport system permease protein
LAPTRPNSFVAAPFAAPSAQHVLGGDNLGRDVLSRVLAGGWQLLLMALAATIFGVGAGLLAGTAAGYLRGKADGLIMRTVDVILAFPQLVFALLLVSMIGPKVWLVVVAVGVSHAPAVARVMRSATLDIAERDYVRQVELQGVSSIKVMRREVMPNLISPLMVEAGLRMTYSVVVIAGLDFLGFGLPPTTVNWGYMIQEDRLGLTSNPWPVVVPAALIALLSIGISTFTDAIARVAIGIERPLETAALLDMAPDSVAPSRS